jgi:hypothetical protein
MKPFCVSLMMKGKTGLSLLANAAEAILISVFKRLIGNGLKHDSLVLPAVLLIMDTCPTFLI